MQLPGPMKLTVSLEIVHTEALERSIESVTVSPEEVVAVAV